MPIKMLVTDMDGTLLGRDKSVSPGNRAAIERLKQRGVKIVLASGRMVESMLPTARVLNVNAPLIAYNGAALYDMQLGALSHALTIPAHWSAMLCEAAESMGLHIQCYQDDGYFAPKENRHTRAYADAIRIEPTYTQQPLSKWITKDQLKLLIIDEPKAIRNALPALRSAFADRIRMVSSQPEFIECTALAADKSIALARLAAELGIAPDEIVAFGDGENDIDMLRFAGLSYAMGNASAEVQRAADRVALASHQDGVALAIEDMLAERRLFL